MTAFRHHFVAQGFLRGFATPGDASRMFVWVYDKQPGRTPRKKSVRSIAWAESYYAQERDDGSTDHHSMERSLAETIDNQAPPIIRGIEAKAGKMVTLSEEERGRLAFFLGLSLTRVPSFRDGMNDFHTAVAQRALNLEAERDPELGRKVREYGARAVAKPWVSLEPMVRVAEQIAHSAMSKSWQFYVPPPAVSLVTSDNPVIFSAGAAGGGPIGPAHPLAELVMNLRSDLAVVCTPRRSYPSMLTFPMSPVDARKFNRGVVRAARQRVFANHLSDTLDKFVKKFAGDEQRVIV